MKVRIQDQSDSPTKFTNVGSGVEIDRPLVFALFDSDNQVVNINSKDNLRIFTPPGSDSTVKGVNSVNFQAGLATVEGIIFVDQPGAKNISFKTSTDAIDAEKVSSVFPDQDSNNDITVDFRFCEPGEENTQQGT